MRVSAGALLMLVNSVAVVTIGVIALPVLRAHHEIPAYAYLVARTVEGVMLATGVVFLLLLIPLAHEHADAAADSRTVLAALARVATEGNRYCFQIAMMALGLGSLLFCRVLSRARLVPRHLAGWGLVGYAVFLVGAILELLGYRVGMALSIPGGLFEVALGALLVAKGFPTPVTARATGGPTPRRLPLWHPRQRPAS
ncbi:DUF4386 domain-containing protein [Micromonospora sp. KC723]|uniref:DUF4386 domain-containing protein n=1 Tax=Micromonospora sp. KC723 TaxID=2530381 RepID=UPI0010505EB4|nr:DUF4386 domain-containing protein [Micromonospora sp. KC723]TDB69749.1 DUF4386 domain-containing protein [Micromonospora sp. KC723]